MPTLQVRDLPKDIYISLKMAASKENRSIAQQTIILLKEALGLHKNNKLKRQALLEKICQKDYPPSDKIDSILLIREDRER